MILMCPLPHIEAMTTWMYFYMYVNDKVLLDSFTMINPRLTKLSGSMVNEFRGVAKRVGRQFSHDDIDVIDFAIELGKYITLANLSVRIPSEKMRESILMRLDLYVGNSLVSSL